MIVKKITKSSDLPNSFFLEDIPVYRGVVERKEIIRKPENLNEINGRKIFALKDGGKINNSKDYEEFLVDLDDSRELLLSRASSRALNSPRTKSAVQKKRRRLLDQQYHTFHYLNQERVSELFGKLKYQCQISKRKGEICTKIDCLDEIFDSEVSSQFVLYLHDLLRHESAEENHAILDLEFTRESSKKLSDFDAHVETIKNEGYAFEEFQLESIRSRLELEDKVGILTYLKTLAYRPVIISASFKIEILNVKLNDDESGYYNVHFRHTDSDIVGLDIVVSTLVPRKDVAPELRLIYDSPEIQPFDAVVVGTVIHRPDLFTNRGCDLYITPTAVYS